MKRYMCFVIVLVMALSMCSCENMDQINVTRQTLNARISLSWWGNEVRSDYTLRSIDKFEEKNDITVTPRYCEFAGYKGWMDSKLNAGELPDVMQMNYNWLYEYTKQGVEFYDLYELKDTIKLNNFSPDQLKFGEVDGKLMGIPISLNCCYFFYNTNVLHKYNIAVPKTWEELISAGQELKKHGVYAAEMGEKGIWLCCVAYTEQKTGKPMFDKKGNFQYGAQECKELLEFYKRFMESGITPRPQDFNHMDFYSGRAAGLFCWISDTKSYFGANIGVNAESVNISIGDLPYISDDNKAGWYKKPMALYCISKDTKEPENSAKLVDHLLNDEENAALQGTEKGIPLSRSAQEVLAARDMMSELQAVANRKMNGDVYIDVMSPVLENEQLMKDFYAAGDDVTYNNADALKKGEEFSRAAAKVNENAK